MKAQGGGMPLIYFQQIFDDMISSVGFNYTLFRGFSTLHAMKGRR